MTKENANSKIEEKDLRLLEDFLEESPLIKTHFYAMKRAHFTTAILIYLETDTIFLESK